MAASWCAAGRGTEPAGQRWCSAAPASFPGAAQSAASSARTQSPFTPAESRRAQTRPNRWSRTIWNKPTGPTLVNTRREEDAVDSDATTRLKLSPKAVVIQLIFDWVKAARVKFEDCCKSCKVSKKNDKASTVSKVHTNITARWAGTTRSHAVNLEFNWQSVKSCN